MLGSLRSRSVTTCKKEIRIEMVQARESNDSQVYETRN